jgi:hypothetical protein
MQRRKFVVGLGSLAAGASAAVGTGALSKTAMDRDLTGTIADDTNSAYVQVSGSNRNGAHVDTSGTQIALRFDGTNTNGGDGLNSDSINWFDNTFGVRINDIDDGLDPQDYDVWITKNPNMARPGRLHFYNDQARNDSIVGSGNANAFSNSGVRPVGVRIDLRDMNLDDGDTLEDDVFGLSGEDLFTIHVDSQN